MGTRATTDWSVEDVSDGTVNVSGIKLLEFKSHLKHVLETTEQKRELGNGSNTTTSNVSTKFGCLEQMPVQLTSCWAPLDKLNHPA